MLIYNTYIFLRNLSDWEITKYYNIYVGQKNYLTDIIIANDVYNI